MNKTALVLATVGALGLTSVATTTPAEARWRGGGFGPTLAGGLIAGAVFGGLASSAYAFGPGYGYGYYGYPRYYGGYAPAYYGGYNPYSWGGYTTAYYGPGTRRPIMAIATAASSGLRSPITALSFRGGISTAIAGTTITGENSRQST